MYANTNEIFSKFFPLNNELILQSDTIDMNNI